MLILSIVFFVTGCKAQYIDISSDPSVSDYIGRQYEAKFDMQIAGINLPPGYGKSVDLYSLRKLYAVQHKAPEIITTDIFPKGGTFKIEKIYKCKNCLSFGNSLYATILTNDFIKSVNVPIEISINEIQSKEIVALIK